MRALKYFLNEAAASLLRSWRSAALAILTIAAGLFVLGFFLMVNTNLQRVVGRWSEAAELSVYLRGRRDAASSCRRSTSDHRAERPVATSGSTCRRPTRWRASARTFPTWRGATERLERNPFPASIDVRLGPTRDGERRPSTTLAAALGVASRVSPTCATTAGG